jgi:glycosyltransferase involved in cell wall biosynthesis
MPHDLVFALPDGSDRVSGGNIYNDRLIRELRTLVSVDSVSIDQCRDRVGRGEAGCYLIDSLNLREFLEFPTPRPGQSFTLIVHHLPSLEPGANHDPQSELMRVEREALARFDAFLATSTFTATYLVDRECPAARILTVPPGSPTPGPPNHETPRVYLPPVRALMVGHMIPGKAMRALFVALEPRLAPGDELSIDVVGRLDLDPEYARRCRDLTEGSARLASIVRYRGSLPPAEMPAQYQAANVFVSASRMETFGMALQEAHTHGLPIVALDGGYVRHHFTDGEDGLLFFSLEALADGLLELVRDPQRAAALFARAQGRAQAADRAAGVYDWPAAAQLFLTQLAALR